MREVCSVKPATNEPPGEIVMSTKHTKLHESRRWLAAAPVAIALLMLQSPTAHAGPCLPVSQPLLPIPELVRNDQTKVLRGTILLTDEQRRLIFRSPPVPPDQRATQPGQPGTFYDCLPQHVRAFHGIEAVPKVPVSPGGIIDPFPGPTLRARLGDIIQLTFLNQINPGRFPKTMDEGEKRGASQIVTNPEAGCDTSTPSDPTQKGYPADRGDTFPDCFHGSSTGNLHFHGTHTNPNGTGDNVYLAVRPALPDPVTKKLPVTADSVRKPFTDFFTACETALKGNPLSTYPQTWNDKPLGPYTTAGTWTAEQKKLLQDYDARTGEHLWDANQGQINNGLWPQYYIGAYPYCFRIPEYKETTWPPPPGGLQMGQSPGTHWYHAHKHGSTAINVANGMTGVFIIEGPYDDALNAFYGDKDNPEKKPLWTRTQPVIVINQLGVTPNLLRTGPAGQQDKGQQDKGPDFTVNGRFQPVIDMAPGEVQLWRIANTSGRSGAYFGNFAPGIQWMQIAQDGVQFADENYKASKNKPFLVAAGNRADLLVKAPATPGTYPVMVKHDVDPSDLPSAFPVVLMQIRVRGVVPPAPPVTGNRLKFIDKLPAQPPFLTNITDAEVASQPDRPRVITFASTGPGAGASHTINGHKFEDDKPGDKPITVALKAVEEWKIVNASYGPLISHPFHIHINPFQVLEVFRPNDTVNVKGKTVPKYVFYDNPAPDPAQCYLNPHDPTTWKDCKYTPPDPKAPLIWWDVFPIPSGIRATDAQGNPIKDAKNEQIGVPGFFRMRSRFVDFAGQYVLHCHILAHEDRGMMAIVQVSDADKPTPAARYMHH
jgi:FtsP/CotA-like multicopper oxidase with cupredoxin domain